MGFNFNFFSKIKYKVSFLYFQQPFQNMELTGF